MCVCVCVCLKIHGLVFLRKARCTHPTIAFHIIHEFHDKLGLRVLGLRIRFYACASFVEPNLDFRLLVFQEVYRSALESRSTLDLQATPHLSHLLSASVPGLELELRELEELAGGCQSHECCWSYARRQLFQSDGSCVAAHRSGPAKSA